MFTIKCQIFYEIRRISNYITYFLIATIPATTIAATPAIIATYIALMVSPVLIFNITKSLSSSSSSGSSSKLFGVESISGMSSYSL